MEPPVHSPERPLVEVRGLSVHFAARKGPFGRRHGVVRAVDRVSVAIGAGETLGLVGESGCGKTTLGRAVLRLVEPTSGSVLFAGRDISRLGGRELRALRREMQVVFQDPQGSLNPRWSAGEIVGEGLAIHGVAGRTERARLVSEALERVGLPRSASGRYPHELSGGQRQRVGIARAVVLGPRFIVCDEALSALDVSVQAQIANLLVDLREELGIAYLFVAHDLSLVEDLSDRVAVMYAGEIVELAPAAELFSRPLHPYTRALVAAAPVADPERRRTRILLSGEVPSPFDLPPGCRFHSRCPVAVKGLCDVEAPRWTAVEGREVACHLAEEDLRRGGASAAAGSANPPE